jgi:D-arginine dehydrogenase
MVTAIRASGGTLTFIDAYEARAQVPLLREDYLAGAALDAAAMDIDVHALHQGFLRGARTAGAELIMSSPVTQVQRRNGVWSIVLHGATITAPILINAAGAWADEIAILCGAAAIGLQPLRRTAMLIDPPQGVDIHQWPAVIDADEQFYFKPDAGKLLLSPADENPSPPCDAQPEELDIALAVDRVEAALNLEVRRIGHRWAGLRTFSADRAPVVGFDAQRAGFFWCAGQGGYGIQTAPAMGRTAAALAKHESLPCDIASHGLTAEDLSPRRFAATAPAT